MIVEGLCFGGVVVWWCGGVLLVLLVLLVLECGSVQKKGT